MSDSDNGNQQNIIFFQINNIITATVFFEFTLMFVLNKNKYDIFYLGTQRGAEFTKVYHVLISGRICGNNNTSRIDGESVNNITKRSIPIPSPAVGGIPYSNARI